MNRKILFRGKSIYTDEWLTGYYLGSGIISQNEDYRSVDDDTVGQYIGLKDKNGRLIFEGDICRFREWSNGPMCWIGQVHYEHQQFVISGGPNQECSTPFTLVMSKFISKNIEVIGNVYDNHELIGGK